MTMEALPMEVLTHILQYLSLADRLRSEQVCKKWRDASRHTWKDVQTLYIIKPDKPDYYFRFRNCTKSHELVEKEDNRLFIGSDSPKIIRCLIPRVGYFIKKFIFTCGFTKNYRRILSFVNNYCHNLRIFEIGPTIGDDDEDLYSRLFECNKELHSIRFYRSKGFLKALPLRNWKSLCCSTPEACYEEKILSLIEHSEALEKFEFPYFGKPIEEALWKCRNLESLDYTTDDEESFEWISDVPLLNRLTNLKVFTVAPNADLLCNMLQHCCQLKRLKINGHYGGIMQVKLFETIRALPVLETLKLESIVMTDDMLIYLMNVKNLGLTGNSITNSGILQMIKTSEVLEKLDIRNTCTTPKMFEQLVREMSDRSKYLEVMVRFIDFNKVSKICVGSKIRVVRDMQCFKNRFG